jgi:hypothetical protein
MSVAGVSPLSHSPAATTVVTLGSGQSASLRAVEVAEDAGERHVDAPMAAPPLTEGEALRERVRAPERVGVPAGVVVCAPELL